MHQCNVKTVIRGKEENTLGKYEQLFGHLANIILDAQEEAATALRPQLIFVKLLGMSYLNNSSQGIISRQEHGKNKVILIKLLKRRVEHNVVQLAVEDKSEAVENYIMRSGWELHHEIRLYSSL